MGKIFQVTAMPRSGTAFVCAFLNLAPNCVCHHELAAERDDWREFIDEESKRVDFVGEISTYGFLPRALRHDGKKVFIERDPFEAHKAAEVALRRTISFCEWEEVSDNAKAWAEEHLALRIDFKKLFQRSSLERIWEYCLEGSTPFPADKAEVFLRMNIQRHEPEKAFGDIEAIARRVT